MIFKVRAFHDNDEHLFTLTKAEVVLGAGHGQLAGALLNDELIGMILTWDDNPVTISEECVRIDGYLKGSDAKDLGRGYWLLSAVKE